MKDIFPSVSRKAVLEWFVSWLLLGLIIFGPMIAFDLLSK